MFALVSRTSRPSTIAAFVGGAEGAVDLAYEPGGGAGEVEEGVEGGVHEPYR